MDESIKIRNAMTEDITMVAELENEIWPKGTRAPREKFETRLKIFPQGFFIAFKNDKIIGASTSEIISYDSKSPIVSWESITDNGWIKNTHNHLGNTLYVVSIGAISRSGAGSALIEAQKNLSKKLNLSNLILGARIPGYDSYCKENGDIDVNDYVKLEREDGKLLDPELRFYLKNGLTLSSIMPNYMEDDSESRNYGVLIIKENKY